MAFNKLDRNFLELYAILIWKIIIFDNIIIS